MMSRYTSYYILRQEQYLSLAKNWISWAATADLSEEEIAGISRFFKSIGKRFGLITEFKEIGVIK